MEELIISKTDLVSLEQWINEIPTKYGMPLLTFLTSAKQKMKEEKEKEEKEEKETEETK